MVSKIFLIFYFIRLEEKALKEQKEEKQSVLKTRKTHNQDLQELDYK